MQQGQTKSDFLVIFLNFARTMDEERRKAVYKNAGCGLLLRHKKNKERIMPSTLTAPLTDLRDEILALKQAKDATILAHYYQEGEIQDLADHVGDSLNLARAATKVTTSTIVFCGVHFMAETAKILNPAKRVLLPDLEAGCSL